MKLVQAQKEYSQLTKAIDKVYKLLWDSEVMKKEQAEREKANPTNFEGARSKAHDHLYEVTQSIKPIFEKHAGKLAIAEAP